MLTMEEVRRLCSDRELDLLAHYLTEQEILDLLDAWLDRLEREA